MGVFDKIKNIFFEEEYVEVEEEIKKPKKAEPKKEKITVAKKIDLPEIKKERVKPEPKEEIEEVEEEAIEEVEEAKQENKFKFPMTFEEEDFKQDEVLVEKVQPKEEPKKEEKPKYIYENERVPLYEGREEKKEKPAFKPTPIISPIYGILDKNYKKEEIVTKKPIILSSSSSRKMDLDRVREKAYGDLASDITASMQEEKVDELVVHGEEKENTFYDLNIGSPAVERVTVGDAEEYFNDLGLEYNVDYKDNSMEKATGRRTAKLEEKEEKEDKETSDETVSLENNLFDLIESMYEDKEE
ncbi:MAG: hypothetical protein IJO43_03350 [Bacilli bacterium]|nr:hypothetical protein [Bacilli bacterium]